MRKRSALQSVVVRNKKKIVIHTVDSLQFKLRHEI